MRFLALRLAVPLFCTFAVSLPCQYDGVNEFCDNEIVSAIQSSNGNDLLDGDYIASTETNPEEPNTNPLQSTFVAMNSNQEEPDTISLVLTDSNPFLLAGKQRTQFRPGQSSHPDPYPESPGTMPSTQLRPGQSSHPDPQPESPSGKMQGTQPNPLQPDPGSSEPAPWTPDIGGVFERIAHYGALPYGYSCAMRGLRGNVVSPSDPPSAFLPPSCSN